jgi:hypothetical protein
MTLQTVSPPRPDKSTMAIGGQAVHVECCNSVNVLYDDILPDCKKTIRTTREDQVGGKWAVKYYIAPKRCYSF